MHVHGLAKTIENKSVLSDINFDLKPGEITALIGRNGVGKTTLFSTLTGIYTPDAGDVMIDGKNVYRQPEVKRHIFFLEDNMNYFNTYSVKAVVQIYQSVYSSFDREYFLMLMNKFDLPIKAKLMSFSKGRKALFFIILAFSLNVRYLLLDEPMDGLDYIVKDKILAFLSEAVAAKQTSVLIASHRLDELEEIADRVLILKGSHIELDYYMDEIRTRALKIQVAFKTNKVPAFVKSGAKLLARNGRIYTLLIEENVEAFCKEIQGQQPILYEELPIKIADVFRVYLADEKVEYYEI